MMNKFVILLIVSGLTILGILLPWNRKKQSFVVGIVLTIGSLIYYLSNMELHQVVQIVIASLTILSILEENSDKARNMLAGGTASGAVLIFIRGEDSRIIYDSLIKWDVIILIIFLTIFVDMLDELGYFEYIGIHLVKLTKGNQPFLFVSFGVLMFFMSAFLDNVTAIILLSSLTISVCKRLEISPVPYLIYEIFITGVGAMLTPIGSVPNIILNSAAQIGFGQWVGAMAIFAFVSFIITTLYFLLIYRKFLGVKLSEEKKEELDYLNPKQVIKSINDVYISTGLLIMLIILFVIAERVHVGIELMAVGVAIITMLITGVSSKEMWAKIDWNTLFFFAGLFVLVGSLEKSGALLSLSDIIGNMIKNSPNFLLFLIIFIGGLTSTGLNNIPVSLLFTSIFNQVGLDKVGDQFWYGTVIATNIGASLTPIGSVIVIIAFEVLRKSGYEIKLSRYFKLTFPLFLIISLVGFFYLLGLIALGII